MINGKPKYSKKRVAPKRRYAKKTKTPSLGLKRYVKRIVNGSAETKIATGIVFENAVLNGGGIQTDVNGSSVLKGLVSLLDLFEMCVVNQGTAQDQRVGNRIRPVSLILRGIVNSALVPQSLPIEVHMFVYCRKDSNATAGRVPNGIIQKGGSATLFDGSLENTLYPLNKDQYNIYAHRVFKLAGAQNVDGYNNGTETARRFITKLKCPKVLIYQNSSNLITNKAYYVAFGVVNRSQGTLDPATQYASIDCNVTMMFKDE